MKRYLLFVDRPYSFGILRPLETAIRRRGDEAKWYVVKPGDLPQLAADEICLEDVEAVKNYDPRAVFAPGNFVPDFFPGAKVMVFHGLGPIKRGHYRIRGFFDLYCVPGPSEERKFTEMAAQHGNFSVANTGWIKLDPLLADSPAEPVERKLPLVLYAPTFSPSMTSAPELLETISELVKSESWDWIVKFHDKMDTAWIERYRGIVGPRLRIATGSDINPLMRAADVIVSDTSSVVNEGLFLRKPVVTYRNLDPGDHIVDVREASKLGTAIRDAFAGKGSAHERAREYVDEIHPFHDGRSCERVLDATEAFIERVQGTLKPRPLNIIRKLKIRKRMGYYRKK